MCVYVGARSERGHQTSCQTTPPTHRPTHPLPPLPLNAQNNTDNRITPHLSFVLAPHHHRANTTHARPQSALAKPSTASLAGTASSSATGIQLSIPRTLSQSCSHPPETVLAPAASSEVRLSLSLFRPPYPRPGTIALCYQDAKGHESDLHLRDDQYALVPSSVPAHPYPLNTAMPAESTPCKKSPVSSTRSPFSKLSSSQITVPAPLFLPI